MLPVGERVIKNHTEWYLELRGKKRLGGVGMEMDFVEYIGETLVTVVVVVFRVCFPRGKGSDPGQIELKGRVISSTPMSTAVLWRLYCKINDP